MYVCTSMVCDDMSIVIFLQEILDYELRNFLYFVKNSAKYEYVRAGDADASKYIDQ